jgi:hypothetical protein
MFSYGNSYMATNLSGKSRHFGGHVRGMADIPVTPKDQIRETRACYLSDLMRCRCDEGKVYRVKFHSPHMPSEFAKDR